MNILEEICFFLELNSYCSEIYIVGLSELLKLLLKNILEDILKDIKYWIVEEEYREEEVKRFEDVEYRIEKI